MIRARNILGAGRMGAAVLLGIAWLLFPACATITGSRPGGAETDALRLAREWKPPAGYKALGSMKYQGPAGSFAGRAAWMGSPPDCLRIEILSPFGQPVFRVAADGWRLYLSVAGEDRIRMHSPDGPALEKILGADASVEELLCLLSGRPSVPEFKAARWEEPGPGFPGAARVLLLTGRLGRELLRVGLSRDDRPLRAVYYSAAGTPRLDAAFSAKATPFLLSIHGQGGAFLLVDPERLWEDANFPAGAFTLRPTGGKSP